MVFEGLRHIRSPRRAHALASAAHALAVCSSCFVPLSSRLSSYKLADAMVATGGRLVYLRLGAWVVPLRLHARRNVIRMKITAGTTASSWPTEISWKTIVLLGSPFDFTWSIVQIGTGWKLSWSNWESIRNTIPMRTAVPPGAHRRYNRYKLSHSLVLGLIGVTC